MRYFIVYDDLVAKWAIGDVQAGERVVTAGEPRQAAEPTVHHHKRDMPAPTEGTPSIGLSPGEPKP